MAAWRPGEYCAQLGHVNNVNAHYRGRSRNSAIRSHRSHSAMYLHIRIVDTLQPLIRSVGTNWLQKRKDHCCSWSEKQRAIAQVPPANKVNILLGSALIALGIARQSTGRLMSMRAVCLVVRQGWNGLPYLIPLLALPGCHRHHNLNPTIFRSKKVSRPPFPLGHAILQRQGWLERIISMTAVKQFSFGRMITCTID